MSTGERRAELDGVRGVAILLVLVGHGGVRYGLGPLAAAGVTLFFVLSGYLITGILAAEYRRAGRIGLRRFYARRMTRLAPPLFFMLAVVTIAANVPLTALIHPLTWTTNYWSWGFDSEPFAHTWSLGVEEQFYLLWPLALGPLLAARRPVLILAGIVVALIAWRGWLLDEGYLSWAYSGPETAGSAILLGCLAYLAHVRVGGRWAGWALAFVAVGGELLALSIGPTGWVFVPFIVAPACAVMVAASPNARWLRWRPLTACGVASYSLYLWHEPVMRVSTDLYDPRGIFLGAVAGVVAYWLVERPVMRWRERCRSDDAVQPGLGVDDEAPACQVDLADHGGVLPHRVG